MEMAESEGAQRGCHNAYLDTFSFQAPEFYLKLGYEIFGTLEAFPDEYKRFFMCKSLENTLKNIQSDQPYHLLLKQHESIRGNEPNHQYHARELDHTIQPTHRHLVRDNVWSRQYQLL